MIGVFSKVKLVVIILIKLVGLHY